MGFNDDKKSSFLPNEETPLLSLQGDVAALLFSTQAFDLRPNFLNDLFVVYDFGRPFFD